MSGAAGLSAAKRRRAGNDYTSRQEIKMDKQKYRDNMIREEIARSSMAKDVDLAPNFSMDA